jgi:hypothetical protein
MILCDVISRIRDQTMTGDTTNGRHDGRGTRGFACRLVAGAVAVMAVAYPLSLGPIFAAYRTGWLSDEIFNWLLWVPYDPMHQLFIDGMAGEGRVSVAYAHYILWWCSLTNP